MPMYSAYILATVTSFYFVFLAEVVFKERWGEELVCKLTIAWFGSCHREYR